MKNFFKTQRISLYLVLGAVILNIIGLVLINSSSAMVHPLENLEKVNTYGILGIILLPVGVGVGNVFRGKLSKFRFIGDLILAAGVIFLAVYITEGIVGRADLMGYVWFSNLEKSNPASVSAMSKALVSWILDGIGLAAAIVAIFFGTGVKEVKKEPVQA